MGIKPLTSLVITQGTQTQSYVINIRPSHNLRFFSLVRSQARKRLRQYVACTRTVESDIVKIERKTNKGVTMGLDQYAGFRDEEGNVREEFYWRKHARLQQFMAGEFDLQNKDKKPDAENMMHSLGFNGGQGGVKITDDLIARLENAIKDNYYDYFAPDGFFWGQQFQEEQVKEYKEQDEKFVQWCKDQLKEKQNIGYDCSW